MPAISNPKQRTYTQELVEVRRTSKGKNLCCDLAAGQTAVMDARNPSIAIYLQAGLLERVDGAETPAARDESNDLINAVNAENARLRAEIEKLRAARPAKPHRSEGE